MKIKYIAIFLVLLCCFMGAASAADDVSIDAVDASVDDAVAVDAVSEDIGDSVTDDPILSEDTTTEELQVSPSEINIGPTTDAIYDAIDAIANNGIIYLSAGTYNDDWNDAKKNYTLIGEDNTVIVRTKLTEGNNGTHTFINLIFQCNQLLKINNQRNDAEKIFINCIFKVGSFTISNGNDVEESTGLLKFENCIFEDCNSFIDIGRHINATFTNCTFKNIEADSLIKITSDLVQYVNLTECTFENCVMNGVVNLPMDTDVTDYVAIEDCTYDFDATTDVIPSEDNENHYVNATKLAKPDTTLVADVDDAGNLLVSLTAGDNAVANGKVLISVNGGEAASYDLGEDGTLSIALSDLTDATGKLNIAVTFEETDDYKGSTASASAVLVVKTVTEKIDPVATSITASDITATAKIAKTLSITLKDANGNALANKAVKVTVNGKTSTVTTDKNGVAKVTVNYAKAGTYYYTFTYLGDNDYKASMKAVKVTVNKQATKATFAKKTFKVKATKKISFTLKDSKGKAIAKKKITFKVNGKTYTAKTNSKGVATVKIVIKKKGKYTATAKFAGDTTYKAISKKATITIK